MFFPIPSGSEDISDRGIGTPAQYFIGLIGYRPYLLDISFTTADDDIRHFDTGSCFELTNQFKHAKPFAGTEVEDLHLLPIGSMEHSVDGFDVCLGKIHNIDIIADTGAIRRVIVIAEHFEFRTNTGCCLSDIRQQVLRDAVGQFADKGRRVRAYRIEIAQDNSVQLFIRMDGVMDDLFVDLLGIAIRRERFLDRRGLIDRQMGSVRLTIDRTRGGEDDVTHTMKLHDLQERDQTTEVITVVEKRFLYRFVNRLAGSKMNDTNDIRILTEDIIQVHKIAAVHIRKFRFDAGDCFNAIEHIDG